MYIQREIKRDIQQKLSRQKTKVIIIYGARQVGKTSLAEDILKDLSLKILRLNGDEAKTMSVFSSRSKEKIQNMVAGYDLVFLDEAQRIENIGLNLKILHDNHPKLKIIVTGSSSFGLADSVQEPLTGRSWVYHLYPIAVCELKSHFQPYELSQRNLENRLVFGGYPEIFSLNNTSEQQEYLHTLAKNYLYKDVLEIEGIRSHQKIRKLLQFLAFQIGSEVSLTELSRHLEINKKQWKNTLIFWKSFCYFSFNRVSPKSKERINTKTKNLFL